MTTKKQNIDKDLWAIFLHGVVVGLLIWMIVSWSYVNDINKESYDLGFQNASSLNQTWIQIGVNQTLSNNTLMSNVANNFNVFYISQYNAIPVYYNDHLYQCTNFTEVKR